MNVIHVFLCECGLCLCVTCVCVARGCPYVCVVVSGCVSLCWCALCVCLLLCLVYVFVWLRVYLCNKTGVCVRVVVSVVCCVCV